MKQNQKPGTMKNEGISAEMIDTYYIHCTEQTIHVHQPSYINIEKDAEYHVAENKNRVRICNSKVIVTLWKGSKNMHVTVL
jgi:hypothetical protein